MKTIYCLDRILLMVPYGSWMMSKQQETPAITRAQWDDDG